MVSIQKFRIIVLISNQIKYWIKYLIRFEISNIRTALQYNLYWLYTVFRKKTSIHVFFYISVENV